MSAITMNEALTLMHQAATAYSPSTKRCAVRDALHQVAADDIYAPINSPPFAVSAMDGVALHASDFAQTMPISQTIFAGMVPQTLVPHTAARIFTGAALPEGANTVVPQEDCTLNITKVIFHDTVTTGSWVRQSGTDCRKGERLILKNSRFTALHLAVCAGLGITYLTTYRSLRVAIITTGDEVIMPPTPLSKGKIYNSSATFLIQLMRNWQCIAHQQHIADDAHQLQNALTAAIASNDLVITTGGVSVGDADYVQQIVSKLATIHFWGIKVRPGKPFLFATANEAKCYICGLPGNPVSVLASMVAIVRPFIQYLQQAATGNSFLTATARFAITHPIARDELRRIRIVVEDGITHLEDIAKQESHMLASCLQADGLALLPALKIIRPGDQLFYIPFSTALVSI